MAWNFVMGPKGFDFNVDARSVYVGLPAGMTAQEALALADRLSPRPLTPGPAATE